jgi:hypothetical protein
MTPDFPKKAKISLPGLQRKPAVKTAPVQSPVPDDTAMALKNLRMMVRDVAQNWSSRLEGELAAVIEEIEAGAADPAINKKKEWRQSLGKIHKIAMDPKIKMDKGRMQDIRKLHAMVKNIRQIMEELDK